jgi:hypothetical protein
MNEVDLVERLAETALQTPERPINDVEAAGRPIFVQVEEQNCGRSHFLNSIEPGVHCQLEKSDLGR